MAYIANEPRCKTREQIGRNATIVFAPAILDERTWSAVHAIGLPAEGHLEFFRLYDKTSGNSWLHEGFLPVSIPLGHVVWAQVDIINDSSYSDLAGKLTVEFLDPDGISVGKRSFTYSAIAPGEVRGVTTDDVTLDEDGTWKIHAKFEI